VNPLVLREDGMLILIHEAFVRREDTTGIAFHQGRETLDVVGAGCQERVMGNQAAPRDAQ
jgi:hypothetical protein